jgi:hypothetical protein
MLANILVLVTLFAASAFGAAMPAPDTSNWIQQSTAGDPIKICKDRGIDVNGPIPSDAVKESDGGYHFAPDSNAFHWVRAQIATAASGSKKRNDPANIGIGMFAQDWCNGQGAWFDDVIYGNHNYGTTNYFSVGISYRGLRSNEHLDFSKYANGDYCGQYVYSAGYMTPVGCFNSQAINCFELWS